MPSYEYECLTCGKVEVVLHGMFKKPRVKCPCGGKTRKIMSPPAGIKVKGG